MGYGLRRSDTLSIFVHIWLICGPIDSNLILQMKDRVGLFLRTFSLTVNLASSFFKMPPVVSRSSYFNETNVLRKAIDSTIDQNPWITLATTVGITRNLDFHPFLETTPMRWPPWPVKVKSSIENRPKP
jgi:hypothetical protein